MKITDSNSGWDLDDLLREKVKQFEKIKRIKKEYFVPQAETLLKGFLGSLPSGHYLIDGYFKEYLPFRSDLEMGKIFQITDLKIVLTKLRFNLPCESLTPIQQKLKEIILSELKN